MSVVFLFPPEVTNPCIVFSWSCGHMTFKHKFELILEKIHCIKYILCSDWIILEYVISEGTYRYQYVQFKGDNPILNLLLDIFKTNFTNIVCQLFNSLLLYRFKLVCFQFSSNFIGHFICHMTCVFLVIIPVDSEGVMNTCGHLNIDNWGCEFEEKLWNTHVKRHRNH